MAYGDRVKSIDEGNSSEQLFATVMESHGWKVRPANIDEQYKHIDFFLEKNDVSITVDVKAKKRLSSKDSGFLTGWLWIEIAGHAGNPGWLYGEQTDVGFHTEDGFLVVSRKSLAGFCESKVDLEAPTWEWATESKDAKYKMYRRWYANGGKSLEKSVLINIEDLKSEITYKMV